MPLDRAIDEALVASGTVSEPAARATRAPPLTARELEVAALVARGLSNREIAEQLVISERTADRHMSNILDKLGLAHRAQVAAWATEQRLPGASRG